MVYKKVYIQSPKTFSMLKASKNNLSFLLLLNISKKCYIETFLVAFFVFFNIYVYKIPVYTRLVLGTISHNIHFLGLVEC